MQNYTMKEALNTMMLSCEANHTRTRCCLDCEGNPFDNGSEEIYNNVFDGIETLVLEENPAATAKQIEAVKAELTMVYVKNKGFFEPLRIQTIELMNNNFNHSCAHWIMLYITFDSFRRTARLIGGMADEHFSVEKLINGLNKDGGVKLSHKEVTAVLKTMENLGGIEEVSPGEYIRVFIEPTYRASNSKANAEKKTIVENLLKKAVKYISKGNVLEREGAFRATPVEYEVKSTDADILKGFFPLEKLFYVFS